MGKKIKVLHFELEAVTGGIESFLYNVYSVIDRNKIQFDFVTTVEKPALAKPLKELGGKIFTVSSLKNPYKYIKDINSILKNGNYDIVHLHKNSAANILPVYVIKKYKNIKIIVHSHNTRPSCGKITYLLHYLNRGILWKNSDIHLACSKIAGNWLYGESKEFKVIKNGILAEKYKFKKENQKECRCRLGIPDNATVIGNVGRFSIQKNQKRLLEIFKCIYEIDKNVYLIMIGEGEEKANIKTKIKTNKFKDNIRCLGNQTDINKFMAAMDIFIMPSLYEGLPIVAVEAQASGLIVWLADTISSETEISRGVRWFCLENDNQNIAKKVLIQGKNNCEERVKQNQEVINNGFDVKSTSDYLGNLYRRCVK